MKYRHILIIIAFSLSLTVQCKTTYIPTYRSFIQIKQGLNDSVMAQSNLGKLDLTAQDRSFSITLVHEDVDKQKVMEIKRAKAAAGWMTFAAIMSGVSTGFNSTYNNNALTTYIGMRNTENIAVLSGFMHAVAKAEQRLTIDFFIDNLSEQELMVSDLARGLTWYILPHTSMQFSLANPGIERLRVSDLHHSSVKYADIIGGNSVKKEELEWEDDNCWIIREDNDTSNRYLYRYYYIEKDTFERREMPRDELKDFKKTHNDMKN